MGSPPCADEPAREHERVLLIPRTIKRITERTLPGLIHPSYAGALVLPPGRGPDRCRTGRALRQLRQATGDWEQAGRPLAADTARLQAAGAQILALATNTMH